MRPNGPKLVRVAGKIDICHVRVCVCACVHALVCMCIFAF